jgi:putative Holliday junction resolvase
MGRIIAIDYGKKRTGIAVSDPLKIIATGLTTIDTEQIIYYLKQYCSQETVDTIILGNPMRLDGSDNDISKKVQKCFQQLQKIFPLQKVFLIDERFTSKMAVQTLIDSGLSKKDRQNKALIDEVSATILLQGYMQSL